MGEQRPPRTLKEAFEHLFWLRAFVADAEVESMTGGEAVEHLEFCSKLERLGAAGSMVFAPQVEQCFAWRQEGHRSAAGFLAARMGVHEGKARGVLETAKQLGELPETATCLRRGDFSVDQVKAIAAAASVHPGAEGELIEAAARSGLKSLQARCERTKALASWENDEVGRERAIHGRRFFRHFIDTDGGVRFEAKVTPADGARIKEAVGAMARSLMDEARAAGVHEPMSACAADAFVALADHAVVGTGTGIGRPTVVLRVDLAALKRGETDADELCEIPGIGPVSLATARRTLGDCFLKIVIREGSEIRSVCHPGRTIPAHLETALQERDPQCVVPGCDNSLYLQTHHRVAVHEHGRTTMENLVRICTWHHDLISYEGWRIDGRPGSWSWHPPPDFEEP